MKDETVEDRVKAAIEPEGKRDNPPASYSYQEVATMKQVKVKTVQAWVRLGMIPSPIYTGYTARFTHEQVMVILNGTAKKGTYPVGDSPRRDIGRMGGNPNVLKPKKKKRSAAKKVAAKKPTGKRPKK